MSYFAKCEVCGKQFNDRSAAEAHVCPYSDDDAKLLRVMNR